MAKLTQAELVQTAMRLRKAGIAPDAKLVFVSTRRSSGGMSAYYKVLFLTCQPDNCGYMTVTTAIAKIAGLRLSTKDEIVVHGCGFDRAQHVFEVFASCMAQLCEQAEVESGEVAAWKEVAQNPKCYNYQKA